MILDEVQQHMDRIESIVIIWRDIMVTADETGDIEGYEHARDMYLEYLEKLAIYKEAFKDVDASH